MYSSSPSADHMNVMAQAEKDIDYVSERLARSIFERRAAAENRLLMRTIGTSPRQLLEFSEIWNMCDLDLRDILGCLVHAFHSAQEEAGRRCDESYFDHWWAAWVSSPVSTRLLLAMQTLTDGCIFQVRAAHGLPFPAAVRTSVPILTIAASPPARSRSVQQLRLPDSSSSATFTLRMIWEGSVTLPLPSELPCAFGRGGQLCALSSCPASMTYTAASRPWLSTATSALRTRPVLWSPLRSQPG